MHHLGKKMFGFLKSIIRTLRLALPKLGVGWMFALLTIDFNRIAIVELGIAAILITAMLSLHYFLSPFQVISGRFADRHPIFGLRRTPYLLVGGVVGSLIFIGLPRVVHAIGEGSFSATLAGFGLLILYGVAIAFMGDAHHSLDRGAQRRSGDGVADAPPVNAGGVDREFAGEFDLAAVPLAPRREDFAR